MIRIPRGLRNKNGQEHERENEDIGSDTTSAPVLIMHGFMSSADDFVIAGPENGFAFMLADRGYDVYLGNIRGSTYGQRHSTLNPNRDAAFWNFK